MYESSIKAFIAIFAPVYIHRDISWGVSVWELINRL
jgi:hypothetical protein